MHYFNNVDWLFGQFASTDSQPLFSSPSGSEIDDSPESIVMDAKMRFESVFRLYYLRHGFECWDLMLLHFHIVLGFMAIKALADAQDQPKDIVEALQSTLALALKGHRESAESCCIGKATFRVLRDSIKGQDHVVFRELSNVNDEDEDRKALLARHVHSEFPINIVSIADDIEARKVGNLVAAYTQLGLEDHSDGNSSSDDSS